MLNQSQAHHIATNLGCDTILCINNDQLVYSSNEFIYRLPISEYGIQDNIKMVRGSKWSIHNQKQGIIKIKK
mgnify:CR=1 FL=1